jgi:prepilin-type N-terminal cleavage/methylation domain-containing protein
VRPGFALAEVLVALAVAGLLLAGIVRVQVAALEGAGRVNRALAARRGVDWALARLSGDLELAGHLLPLPGRTLPPAPAAIGWPGGWRLLPGGAAEGPESWGELVFAYDRPLPAPVRLAEAVPEGAGPAVLLVRAPRSLRLRAGDLLLVPGQRLGWAAVAEDADLDPGRTVPVVLEGGLESGGPAGARPAGTLLHALRPGRLVCFRVVRLGPGNVPAPGGEPCLVRLETACPPDGREPRWQDGWKKGSGIRREVLVRGVTRFRATFAPAGERRPAAFLVELAAGGPAPGAPAAGFLRVALRHGGR